MLGDQRIREGIDQSQEHALLDGVPCNGFDSAAERRAHMRELTMARQAAERRQVRPPSDLGLDRPAQLVAARERAVELRDEMARLDCAHRDWLLARGEDVAEPPSRHHKPKPLG